MTVNQSGRYYVSVTTLVLKSWLYAPKFFYYTSKAFKSAEQASGNISSIGTSYKGAHMTITVWENKEAMLKFFRGEAHAAAMKITKDISSYSKMCGYFTDEMPSHEDAIKVWKRDGRRVHGDADPLYGDKI